MECYYVFMLLLEQLFNYKAIEGSVWVINYILHKSKGVITYTCCNLT